MHSTEKSQTEKAAYCVIPSLWPSGKGRTIKTVKRRVVTRGWRREGGRGGAERISRALKLL